MAQHTATVSWRAAPGPRRKGRFSRAHVWQFDGGIEVPASSSPAVIPPPWSEPHAVDPEEALVAAVASCHLMSFLWVADKRGIAVREYRDEAVGELGRNADGKRAITRVTLNPVIVYADGGVPDATTERALHDEAHAECYIAHSVTAEIVVA